jgi:hypothetical protein
VLSDQVGLEERVERHQLVGSLRAALADEVELRARRR